MDSATRRLVRERAKDRCEYCGLPQSAFPALRFHVEHIKARQHGGSDDPANLALACGHCNRHKGPNLTGVDPLTDQITPLFNPREHRHSEHFASPDIVMIGLTAIGRATINLLAMNSPTQLENRSDLE